MSLHNDLRKTTIIGQGELIVLVILFAFIGIWIELFKNNIFNSISTKGDMVTVSVIIALLLYASIKLQKIREGK
jgi:hypothetical protein